MQPSEALERAIELATAIGRIDARKARGDYSQDDARIEAGLRESLSKYRTIIREAQQTAVPHKVRWTPAQVKTFDETFADMRIAVLRSPLAQIGDTILVWVNEGDIIMHGQRIDSEGCR